jgi:hypothetical protein
MRIDRRDDTHPRQVHQPMFRQSFEVTPVTHWHLLELVLCLKSNCLDLAKRIRAAMAGRSLAQTLLSDACWQWHGDPAESANAVIVEALLCLVQ